MSDRLRQLRNGVLRAASEEDKDALASLLRRMTPAEMRQLRDDAVTIHWYISNHLVGLPPAMQVGDRDE